MNTETMFFFTWIVMSLVFTPFVYVILKLLMGRDGKKEGREDGS